MSQLAESSRPGRGTRGRRASRDASLEEEERGEDDQEDTMEVDDDYNREGTRSSKGGAEKGSTRRSGRRK